MMFIVVLGSSGKYVLHIAAPRGGIISSAIAHRRRVIEHPCPHGQRAVFHRSDRASTIMGLSIVRTGILPRHARGFLSPAASHFVGGSDNCPFFDAVFC